MTICKKCGVDLSTTKYQSVKYCSRHCATLYLKSQWKKRTKEKRNEYNRKWRAANPDKVAAMSLRYKVKNPPKFRERVTAKGREIYEIPCVLCPQLVYVSLRKRKRCPVHNFSTASKRMRFEVLQRDNYRCVYCGRGADVTALHVDHVEARSNGGGTELNNLVTACFDCNIGKSARALTVLPNIKRSAENDEGFVEDLEEMPPKPSEALLYLEKIEEM
jgi:5-methylcytosine-specific restriction endonuclease McrA